MRALRITLSSVGAMMALASVAAHAKVIKGTALEALFRRSGFIDAGQLADEGYGKLWSSNLQQDPLGAIRIYREALIADIASPYRWCDLGEAFVEAGLDLKARYCFARAVGRGPLSPVILMRAANSYFRLAEVKRALECTARVLATVPLYDDVIFATYSRMGISIDQVLAQGMPAAKPRPARSFFRRILVAGSLYDAQKVWTWANQQRLTDDTLADEYASALVKAHRYQAAVDLWLAHLGYRAGDYRKPNCLFNGSFEHRSFGATFDWQIEQLPNARAEWDSTISYSGHSSLRIRFAGDANISYSQVKQWAVVTPGKYLFDARVRTSHITTDHGIAFRIRDAENSNRLSVTTPSLVGTRDWTLVQEGIVVKPPTRLVEVEMVRDPSLRFDSAISGTAWIDDLHLIPAR
jgi:hypothetical protein